MKTALVEKWGRIPLEALGGLGKGENTTEPGVTEIIKPAAMTEIFRGWPEADDMMVAEIREKGLAMGCPKAKLAPGFQERLLEFTGTDETVDRMGDIIRVDGWDFQNFRANPVFMPWHDYRTEPIGQALDVYVDSVRKKDVDLKAGHKPKKPRKRVRFVILFDDDEFSDRIFQKYKDGVMRATSVGFRPTQIKRPDDDEREELGMGTFGVIYEKQELLELSAVSVPANPAALLEADYQLSDDERKEYMSLAEETVDIAPEFALQLRSVVGLRRTTSDRLEFDVSAGSGPEGALERARRLLLETEDHGVIELEKGVIPANVSMSKAPIDATWSAPTLSDFTDGTWGDLTNAQKRRVAGHFSWADASPASSFGGLKLPHHQSSNGAIVFRGIVAAAGRFNQTALPAADKPAVRRHLAAHFRSFGRDVPEVLQDGYEEGIDITWALVVRNELDRQRLLKKADDPGVSWLWDDQALEAAVVEDVTASEFEGDLEKGHIPKDPKDSDNAPMNSPAVSLSPSKLGIEGDLGEAPASERSRVARFFAWAEANPPGEFGQLKFPHHRAKDGFRVFRSVSSNMRDLLGKTGEGENIPNADRRGIWRHLANHFRQFDRTPPPFKAVDDEILRGAVQISPDVWETDGKNGFGKWRYLEETGELSVRNFRKNDGTYDVVAASVKELEEIDEYELEDPETMALPGIDFREWAVAAVAMVRAAAEGLIAIRETAGESPDVFKTTESGLATLLREMSAVRQRIVDALPESVETDYDELEKLRTAIEALSKDQITIQSLKFPKKVWKHESAVRVFAEAAGFISDSLEFKEGFFVLPQRKSALFDGVRDFCLSPGGAEPGDGCRIVATGGTLKSAGELAIGELASLVKEGFDRIEAAVKSPPQGVNRGAVREGANGGAGGDDAEQLYSSLLDVTRELAGKASPSKET